MSKRDSRPKRRKKLFKTDKLLSQNLGLFWLEHVESEVFAHWCLAQELKEWVRGGPPGFELSIVGLSSEKLHPWDAIARKALNFEGHDPFSAALRAAFDKFGLNPGDPFSWRILLSVLAFVEFGKRPRGKAGAPKKWNEERLGELRAALKQIEAGGSTLSEKEIARRLARDPRFGAKGDKATAGREGLRKVIRKARRDLP